MILPVSIILSKKKKAYVQRESEELGRPLTFCVTTFGCQMNARDSEKTLWNPGKNRLCRSD